MDHNHSNQAHIPIMLTQVIEALSIKKDGIYVDATFGRGGHSRAILQALETGKLIAFDQDQVALDVAKETFQPFLDHMILIHGNFRDIKSALKDRGIEKVDGILLDIGVSSPQIDQAQRGFSFRKEGPLDMRMDQTASLTAYDVVNYYHEDELTDILKRYGQEKWARQIARVIVDRRNKKPIETTYELDDVVHAAIPKKKREKDQHPSRRTFQAIRMEVNQELESLQQVLIDGIDLLVPKGRMVVLTFHSLEDRMVKHTFRDMTLDCICPKEFPVCMCDHQAQVQLVNRKPLLPSKEEIESNPRAHSAKLRAVEKISQSEMED